MMFYLLAARFARRSTRCFLTAARAGCNFACLIDRGHRELPIEAAFVGRAVPTTMREVIEVKLKEIDKIEKVLLVEK